MKSLRMARNWSQEQLAQLSGLNVRTIQRVEKGESVGIETLKSLAAVFEMSTDELRFQIEQDNMSATDARSGTSELASEKEAVLEKVKSIKYFYALSAFLVAIFVMFMLPNYNGGENSGALLVVFLSFAAIIGALWFVVFEPFGEKWEREKVAKILAEQDQDGKR